MNQPNILESIKIKTVSETEQKGVFEMEGLYRGYGTTMGNALRRILLSSLKGAAVTKVKIKGVNHEFSSVEGVMEDVIEIALNLKRIRFRMHTDEPQVLSLKVKGEKEVKAEDIETNAQIEVINLDSHIATLTSKSMTLEMELTIEKGLGYVPTEERKTEKLSVGTIAIDAIFTPVTNVNFTVEDMRVGERTDYNRLKLLIDTDGTVSPSAALKESIDILKAHLEKISIFDVKGVKEPKEAKKETVKKAKKAGKKK
ncbi:MAG: DNA-directed RNA polymerase subunit alpha [Candidatus Paceibacterota bacterium]|jgi:DNA-directed RNA polymerase subunit alpha